MKERTLISVVLLLMSSLLLGSCAADIEQEVNTPSGRIAFTSDRDGNNEIYVMYADGTNQHNLTNNTADDNQASWSPDGDLILFSTDRDGNMEEALGHASVAFTMDTYSHIIEGMQEDAIALLDEVLPAGKNGLTNKFNANFVNTDTNLRTFSFKPL